jgi:catechol 2,3-dioxygenase-like lactoylglutathione lyase family enzyme
MDAATAPIPALFPPTHWRTVALDHLLFEVPDAHREAAFFVALMGWTPRKADDSSVVLDIGKWGTAVFRRGPVQRSVVRSFCFVIEPWNAKTVESELRARGLTPIHEDGPHGFESVRVRDPDGFDLQIANGNGQVRERRSAGPPLSLGAVPFPATGWTTVWLDHLSFTVTNYKESAAFYSGLMGWRPTYDEGSQHELMIGDIGEVIIRGGNPNNPAQRSAGARQARVDHISFGISPWDTDGVKADLQKRGLDADVDTSTVDEIHVAPYKSYHTETPAGYNLQISFVTEKNRLALSNAVKPRALVGR